METKDIKKIEEAEIRIIKKITYLENYINILSNEIIELADEVEKSFKDLKKK